MTDYADDSHEDGCGGFSGDGSDASNLLGHRGAVAAAFEEPLRDDHDTDVPRAWVQPDHYAEPDGPHRPERG